MNALETLLARDAQVVGGAVILRNKEMGRLVNGVFVISAEGEAELLIDEVPVVVKPVKAEKPAKPAKVEKVVDKATEPETPALDVDALLNT